MPLKPQRYKTYKISVIENDIPKKADNNFFIKRHKLMSAQLCPFCNVNWTLYDQDVTSNFFSLTFTWRLQILIGSNINCAVGAR